MNTKISTDGERKIDMLVYLLYSLTYDEAKVIDPALSVEEFKKYRLNEP